MLKKTILILLAILGLAMAASDNTITFQGYLTDASGAPVFGTKYMSFRFYTDKTGTNQISNDSNFPFTPVTVYNGNYATKITLQTNEQNALANNGEVWVAVYVSDSSSGSFGSSTLMNPRIQLTATPYAVNTRGLKVTLSGSTYTVSVAGNIQTTGTGTFAGNVNSTGGYVYAGNGAAKMNANGSISGTTGTFSSNVNSTGGYVYAGNGAAKMNADGSISGTTGAFSGLVSAPTGFQSAVGDTFGTTSIGGNYDMTFDGGTDHVFQFNNTGAETDFCIGTAGNRVAYIDNQGLHSAVWNDLAEFRTIAKDQKIIPGKAYVATKDGLKLASKRAEMGTIGVCSDTYGFSLGGDKKDKTKAPIAISGWVLAYVDKDYPIGTALTSGPNGVLTEMTKKEKRDYPERLVGIVDAKPEKYNNIKIDGRYWVKVK